MQRFWARLPRPAFEAKRPSGALAHADQASLPMCPRPNQLLVRGAATPKDFLVFSPVLLATMEARTSTHSKSRSWSQNGSPPLLQVATTQPATPEPSHSESTTPGPTCYPRSVQVPELHRRARTMSNFRLSKSLCAVVGDALRQTGSHDSLERLFTSAGAPGDPPDLAHHSKWKEWLFRAGQDPTVDSFTVLGNVLEEFMDLPPDKESDLLETWQEQRRKIETVLEENGLRYFRFGRVLPQGQTPGPSNLTPTPDLPTTEAVTKPTEILEVVEILVSGLRRAMHPLIHRRKNAQTLSFDSEYDVQDLLHALLRPWVADIRPEEFTPSYAGSSTRMDILLVTHKLVIELKFVRDRAHGKKLGNELIVDIEHYRKHPDCRILWCVVYDPYKHLENPAGLCSDLSGTRKHGDRALVVKVLVL